MMLITTLNLKAKFELKLLCCTLNKYALKLIMYDQNIPNNFEIKVTLLKYTLHKTIYVGTRYY